MNKLIQIVDEHDKPVSESEMVEAWKKGLQHRIVRIMVVDKDENILLQMRSKTSLTFPSLWDPAAAGHVDAGEDYETAAARELKEEIGIDGVKLKEIAYFKTKYRHQEYLFNRFNKLYTVTVPKNIALKIDPEEVERVQWFTSGELKDLLKNKRHTMTDGLIDVLENHMNL